MNSNRIAFLVWPQLTTTFVIGKARRGWRFACWCWSFIYFFTDCTNLYCMILLIYNFRAFSFHFQTKSIFQIGFFTNKMFLYAVGGSLIGQSLVVYFPPLQTIFQTEALGFFDICLLASLASSVLVLDEIRKFIRRRQNKELRTYSNKMDLV